MGTRKRGRKTVGDDSAPVVPIDAERQAVITRLFDGVLRSAESHLCRTHEPLGAEVWASGLLAVWEEMPAPGRDDAGEYGRAFGEALVRHARIQARPEALAVLLALAAVAPTRLATKARTAAAGLVRKGLTTPLWADAAGQAEPTEAWVGRDVFGDQEIVIIGFRYPESAGDWGEHTICVLVDHNLGGRAKDAYPAGPLAATLARWQEAEANGIRLAPVSLSEAAGRLADTMVATEFADPSGSGAGKDSPRRLAELRALLTARLSALPLPEHTGLAELDHEARQAVITDFLNSAEAGDLLSEPATVMLCQRLVDFRCDHGDGDPLRWSPTLAGVCLLEYFPERVHLDDHEMALVSDVMVAWVKFAGRRKGLPPGAIGRTVAVIESCRDDFAVAMGDEDRYGTAKRRSREMMAEGIDLTDDEAVTRWMADNRQAADIL